MFQYHNVKMLHPHFFHFLVVTKQRDPESGQHSLLFQVKRICDKPIYNMQADDAMKTQI